MKAVERIIGELQESRRNSEKEFKEIKSRLLIIERKVQDLRDFKLRIYTGSTIVTLGTGFILEVLKNFYLDR